MHRNFSHLYIERDIFDHPNSVALRERFPKATVVTIESYQEIFHRPRQNFQAQKESMKLILAKKRDGYLYRGSDITPNFGHTNFFYNTLILNCVYNCEYCYLQGMFSSANIVLFVNEEDFFEETSKKLSENGPLYLCISYDTDLLAFEGLLPYASNWLKFASENPELTVELRTKSANFSAISDLQPTPNAILAWTMSPQSVIDQFEAKTPPLASRLEAASKAIEAGWKVRICFDPVLAVDNWKESYTSLVEETFEVLPGHKIHDVSVGVFRMNKDYLKRFKKQRPLSPLLSNIVQDHKGIFSYEASVQNEIESVIVNRTKDSIAAERIFVV